jgi:ribosomal protein S18 acetylase RimI-like enzyme
VSDISFERLTTATATDVAAINHLGPQLSSSYRLIDLNRLNTILSSPAQIFVARYDGHIVAMAQLGIIEQVDKTHCRLEGMATDKDFEGQGIGGALLDLVKLAAIQAGGRVLELTSKPERDKANAFYLKYSATLKKTNYYLIPLSI